MKKFKKLSYISLIVIIIVLGFVIYSISASDDGRDIREKVKAEISYFDSKLTYIFNSLNNIEFENYKLSVEDITQEAQKSSEKSLSEENGNESEDKGKSSDSDNKENSDDSSKTKKFSLNHSGILNNKKSINWNYIKNEVESLQSSISTMLLDLYNISLNNNDILNFSKEFDNLLKAIKEENKEDTLKELTQLYSYLTKFIKNCNVNPQTEIVYSTKYSIFKAYRILDSENWNEILVFLQEADNKFSKLLTSVGLENKNQYIVNKCYILLNELQNSVNLKDKEIFLIKYRNLLEDLNNI